MIQANFFWHGPQLSLYEWACLSSFVRDGFEVRLYTFDAALEVPPSVIREDAGAFGRESEVGRFTHHGQKGSIAAFTDIFRLRLMAAKPGWWFDTDVFCLADADVFSALQNRSSGLLLGREDEAKVNNAVMYFSDGEVAAALLERAENIASEKNDVLFWGELGPALVTSFMQEHPERVTEVGAEVFYPVHYLETADMYLPSMTSRCETVSRNSACVHLWNEFLRRWNVPKNIYPPSGSFLYQLFSAVGARVANDVALPESSFRALHREGEIGRVGNMALKAINWVKRVERAIGGRTP